MTTRPPYKRRLQEHLKETKGHARAVERRIKELGGTAEAVSVPGPEVVSEAASKVQEVAQRGVALAQGAAARGTRHRRGGEAPQERQDRVSPTRPRRSRPTLRSRPSLTSVGDRKTAEAGARHPPPGGAYVELPRAADPAAHQGRGAGGDPRLRAQRRCETTRLIAQRGIAKRRRSPQEDHSRVQASAKRAKGREDQARGSARKTTARGSARKSATARAPHAEAEDSRARASVHKSGSQGAALLIPWPSDRPIRSRPA